MTMITNIKGLKVEIDELVKDSYIVTVYPKEGVTISCSGFRSIEECLGYAENIRKSYKA